ncbi:hypothetical protein AD14_4806 [Escherichia coli 3-073-06_S4_C2]|nr:hypothetical protein AD14_4806 [Escherichia coli 3-073-06_S4_C2]
MYFAISYNTKTNKYHQQKEQISSAKRTKLFSFSYSSRCSLFHLS